MRLFIALRLSPDLREELAAVQAKLRVSGADVKWVEKENLHLTLKFLGETEEEKTCLIEEALHESTYGVTPFILEVEGLGVFPNWQRPRVLWAGIKPSPMLWQLQANIEASMAKLGYPQGDRFHAHLTLGRMRSRRSLASLIAKCEELKPKKWGAESIHRVALVESRLTPEGPQYRDLVVVELKKEGVAPRGAHRDK